MASTSNPIPLSSIVPLIRLSATARVIVARSALACFWTLLSASCTIRNRTILVVGAIADSSPDQINSVRMCDCVS
ncbi:MAG: hypothetical protein AUH95_02400 [Nitrospirae bacterium 13_2_20CM_2_63_8]|nr:MAG: hypothetical protein AUH95_02400 [Nitrospirae bacterium 13_2_20CM_2_63_8]